MKKMTSKGFTLIELLAVITIMGILMMVAIPAVSRTIENSRRDTFADVAQSYLNAVRNAALSDELKCAETTGAADDAFVTVDSLGVGEYWFFLSTNETVLTADVMGSNTGLNSTIVTQTKDLMESGGKSSWGSSDVFGWVHWKKEVPSGSTETRTTYFVALTDASKHGIATDAQDQDVTRSDVATSNAVASITGEIDKINGDTNTGKYYCKYK